MHVAWNKRLSRMIRGRLRRRVLEQHGIAILSRTRNGLLLVDPDDFNVSRRLLREGQYDLDEIELLSSLVGQCRARIIVAGAHIGALVIPIAILTDASHIVAIEPSPHNYEDLELNLHLNRVDRVETLNAAVGAHGGEVRFTENRINRGNSRVSATGEIAVPMYRLDWLTDQSIDLLIMDIEGYEVHALRGAQDALTRTRMLYIEFAPEQLHEQGSTVDEFISLIVAAGFDHCCRIEGHEIIELPQDFGTYLRTLPKRRGLLMNLLLRRRST